MLVLYIVIARTLAKISIKKNTAITGKAAVFTGKFSTRPREGRK